MTADHASIKSSLTPQMLRGGKQEYLRSSRRCWETTLSTKNEGPVMAHGWQQQEGRPTGHRTAIWPSHPEVQTQRSESKDSDICTRVFAGALLPVADKWRWPRCAPLTTGQPTAWLHPARGPWLSPDTRHSLDGACWSSSSQSPAHGTAPLTCRVQHRQIRTHGKRSGGCGGCGWRRGRE